ncbi:MAG: hypothetical protein IH612_10295 [Desulfofustis sp.]|nr:hypothetical protein [Desulfofustis sp.]
MPRRAIAGGFGVASPAISANFIELYDLHYQGFGLWGNIQGELSDQADLVAALAVKADLSYVDDGLAGKSPITHDHDSDYSPLGHNHNSIYAPLAHAHDELYSAIGHDHAGVYEPRNTNIQTHIGTVGNPHGVTIAMIGAAADDHNHNAAYAALLHDHDADYSPLGHVHAIANVTGLQTALDGKSATTHNHDAAYAAIIHNHDTAYSPLGHGHVIADVTNLQASLDAKFESVPLASRFVTDINAAASYGYGLVAHWHKSPATNTPIPGETGEAITINYSAAWVHQLWFPFYADRMFFRRTHNGTWQPWMELWHNGNDGPGSGLDADLLAGQHASDFAAATHSHPPPTSTSFESKTANFTAAANTVYFVTPPASTTVVATLPTADRGRMVFRLEDSSSARKLAIDPTTDAIEGLAAGDRVIVDTQNFPIAFDWDGSVWRLF